MFDLPEWERVLFGALYAYIVRHTSYAQHESVKIKWIFEVLESHSTGVEVYGHDFVSNETDVVFVEKFVEFRRYMPLLYLATEVFVEHRGEKEVVFVADEGDVGVTCHPQRSEKSSPTASENQNSGSSHPR
jgi:hypothetical protein